MGRMKHRSPEERATARRHLLRQELGANQIGLAETVRRLRAITGLTQPAFAELVGISTRTLREIERGKGTPRLSTLTKIGKIYGLEVGLVRRAK